MSDILISGYHGELNSFFFFPQKWILNWICGTPIDFLFNWSLLLQESAIVLAKLLLPQIFEKMAMQDLRALVAEKSTMTIYLSGETIEMPHYSIALLLDGFIKGQGELITSPAALMPSHNLNFRNVDTSGDSYNPHPMKMLSSATLSFFPFIFFFFSILFP